MQVVVDTNVWLSYLLFGGQVSVLFQKLGDEITLWHSQTIESEFQQKCLSKFKLSLETVAAFQEEMRFLSRMAIPTGPAPEICRDPNDNHVLHLCQFVGADILLTGDKDLLVLGQFEQTRILQPAQFAELLLG